MNTLPFLSAIFSGLSKRVIVGLPRHGLSFTIFLLAQMLAAVTYAEVTPVSYWHMGESDSFNQADFRTSRTFDSVGGRTMDLVSSFEGLLPVYAENVAATAKPGTGRTEVFNSCRVIPAAVTYPPPPSTILVSSSG